MDISKLENSAAQLELAANELRGVVELISKSREEKDDDNVNEESEPLLLDETTKKICLGDVHDVCYESWSDTSSTPSQADTSIDDASAMDSVTDSLLSYENPTINDNDMQIKSAKSSNGTRLQSYHHDNKVQYLGSQDAVEVDSGMLDTIKIVDSIDLLDYHDAFEIEEMSEDSLYENENVEEGLDEGEDTISIAAEEGKENLSRNPNDTLFRCPIDTILLDTKQKRSKDWNDDKDEKEGVDSDKINKTIGITPEKNKEDCVSCNALEYPIDDNAFEAEEKTEECVIGKSPDIDPIVEQKTFNDAHNVACERYEGDAVCSPSQKNSTKNISNEEMHGDKPFRRKKVHFCPQIGLHKIEYTPPTAEEKIYLFYTARDLRHFKTDYLRELYGYKEATSKDPILDDVKDMHGSMRMFWSCYALVIGAFSCRTFTNVCCGNTTEVI